jgi:hypothetical protein
MQGPAPPSHTSLGKFFHHDGMYAKRPLPLCVYFCGVHNEEVCNAALVIWLDFAFNCYIQKALDYVTLHVAHQMFSMH